MAEAGQSRSTVRLLGCGVVCITVTAAGASLAQSSPTMAQHRASPRPCAATVLSVAAVLLVVAVGGATACSHTFDNSGVEYDLCVAPAASHRTCVTHSHAHARAPWHHHVVRHRLSPTHPPIATHTCWPCISRVAMVRRSKLNNGTSPFYHKRLPFLYAFMVCGNLPAGSCGDDGAQCASAQYTNAGSFYQSLGVASDATTSWQLLDSSDAGSGTWHRLVRRRTHLGHHASAGILTMCASCCAPHLAPVDHGVQA